MVELPPPPAIAVPWTSAAPKSGLPAADDPAWKDAAVIAALPLALGPEAAGKSPLPTTVRLLWTADHLLIRFDCVDTDAWSPFGDTWGAPHYQGDVVEVFLDPVGDARQFIELEVSPKNGVYSKLYLATAEPVLGADGVLAADFLRRDQWEIPDWRLEGLQTRAWSSGKDGNWSVILSLPARPLLRRPGKSQFAAGMSLRANFVRYDYAPPAPNTSSATHGPMTAMNWSPIPWGRPHRTPARMGWLRLTGLPTPRNL